MKKLLFFESLLFLIFLSALNKADTNKSSSCKAPQCGQYCVYHICQLKGIPLTMGQIMDVYKFKESRGKFGQSVLVKSNDPSYPYIDLALTGNGRRELLCLPLNLILAAL
jgi:hypothetical protein